MKDSILIFCLFIFYNAESHTWLVSNPKWVYRYEMYSNYGFETNEIVNTNNSTIDSKVIIYPNPASDFVNIIISEELYQYDLQILDINGSVIKTLKPESNKEIDISDLFSGIYIVRLFNKNNFLLKKFIKM